MLYQSTELATLMMKLHLTMMGCSHFSILLYLFWLIGHGLGNHKINKMVVRTNFMRPPVQPPSQTKPVANTGLCQYVSV